MLKKTNKLMFRIEQGLLRLLRTKPHRKHQSFVRNSWYCTHLFNSVLSITFLPFALRDGIDNDLAFLCRNKSPFASSMCKCRRKCPIYCVCLFLDSQSFSLASFLWRWVYHLKASLEVSCKGSPWWFNGFWHYPA